MNCSSSEEHFEALIDGTLPASFRPELLAHVDRCAACASVLEELRVIDALLLAPREATLAPNFTFRIMAEVAAQPVPRPRRAPLLAFLVSYVVAVWMLFALAEQAAGPRTHAFLASLQANVGSLIVVFSGVAQAAGRSVSPGLGSLTALVGGVLALDLALAAAVAVGYFVVRPRLAARLGASEARS